MAKWMLKQTTADIDAITRQTGVSPVLARILAVRGYRDPGSASAFLDSYKADLPDPLLLPDMERAAKITAHAVGNRLKIVVFGDYDADGVMSTVILCTTLKSLDADISYYIPSREGEGYGLNKPAISQLADEGTNLIITCDNGIASADEIAFAHSLGLQVIVLDHHAIPCDGTKEIIPDAEAVVDAKRGDCQYPYREYCGAGICYRFSEALFRMIQRDWSYLKEYCLPFVTIATICDIVDLTGDNRQIVKLGLPGIKDCRQIGMRALIHAAGLDNRDISTYHIGFILGPCINAAGRLETAGIAVELFLTDDELHAKQLAERLVSLNIARRTLTDDGVSLAYQLIESREFLNDKVIVLYSEKFSESVAGVIAGKIKERYNRPTIVLAGDGKVVHGSCRSIEAYNIFEGLGSCSDLLIGFGGHPMAAGLTIDRDRISDFRSAINSRCGLTEEDFQKVYRIDCPLLPEAASLDLAKELEKLEPYGKENPAPLFACKNMFLQRVSLMGKDNKIMRLFFADSTGHRYEAMDFSNKDQLQEYIVNGFGLKCWLELLMGKCSNRISLDFIYTLGINLYNGREEAQIKIVDFRAGNI